VDPTPSERLTLMDMLEINRQAIARFRAGEDPEGMHRDRLLLLTTTGRRSGEPRTSPMMFHLDDGVPVVIASNMGAAQHPEWYRNLQADPAVTVELPDATWQGVATVLAGAERERVWADITRLYPFFVDHQQQAGDREIPLVALAR
jgi:deazaflavin-dependent oxidoreductase (nitroreductase family)